MTDASQRRHGLEPAIADLGRHRPATAGVGIRVRDDLGHVNLRGRAADERFVAAVEQCLGQRLPVDPNTCTNGDHCLCWLGPDEWLILTDAGNLPALTASLEAALSGLHAAVNQVSGGQLALELSGPAVRDVLARGCTLDFHPRVFTAGKCAQSGLAKASVVFALPEAEEVFYVVVRRSFADYLLRWLHHAAAGPGVRIEPP